MQRRPPRSAPSLAREKQQTSPLPSCLAAHTPAAPAYFCCLNKQQGHRLIWRRRRAPRRKYSDGVVYDVAIRRLTLYGRGDYINFNDGSARSMICFQRLQDRKGNYETSQDYNDG
eukprot:scaffold358753_cov14-Prasinocladus_malaysianus.AAC.1